MVFLHSYYEQSDSCYEESVKNYICECCRCTVCQEMTTMCRRLRWCMVLCCHCHYHQPRMASAALQVVVTNFASTLRSTWVDDALLTCVRIHHCRPGLITGFKTGFHTEPSQDSRPGRPQRLPVHQGTRAGRLLRRRCDQLGYRDPRGWIRRDAVPITAAVRHGDARQSSAVDSQQDHTGDDHRRHHRRCHHPQQRPELQIHAVCILSDP